MARLSLSLTPGAVQVNLLLRAGCNQFDQWQQSCGVDPSQPLTLSFPR